MPTLEFEMTYRLKVTGPLGSTEGSPLGTRQYWEMTEAVLEGDKIKARLAMPGGDWYLAGSDGFGRPDVRLQLVTDDGALILLAYTGLVQQSEAFVAAAGSGGATDGADQYMRMFERFDTGSEAEGRLAGRNEIEYRIYRVT